MTALAALSGWLLGDWQVALFAAIAAMNVTCIVVAWIQRP